MGSKSTKSQKRHPKLKDTRILITQEQDIKDIILILGIGETGKSTVSKQFNFLFNPNEKIRSEDYFTAIRKSILRYLKDLIDIATELKLLIQNEEVVKLMGSYELPMTIDSKTYPLLHDKFIDPLWSLVEIKEAYERRDEYQLTERAK
ncbi:gtp-binding protein alpha subunit [Anaeramoeba flamelloides]|uniref:Gtp-binding protein alpha subunit n=1 Tax=Anaeramoeba flamelloides TaxID=1746091 RepID=A0AAV8A3K3_9EUKA|nr:gtp-binding protein alpha subunit [Anaeramoeba flamelloides]